MLSDPTLRFLTLISRESETCSRPAGASDDPLVGESPALGPAGTATDGPTQQNSSPVHVSAAGRLCWTSGSSRRGFGTPSAASPRQSRRLCHRYRRARPGGWSGGLRHRLLGPTASMTKCAPSPSARSLIAARGWRRRAFGNDVGGAVLDRELLA